VRPYAQECMRGVVMGHRAELFAVKAAKALAALDGRSKAGFLHSLLGFRLVTRTRSEEEEEEGEPHTASYVRPPPPPPPLTWSV
jgi:magnesium chelatase subunit D